MGKWVASQQVRIQCTLSTNREGCKNTSPFRRHKGRCGLVMCNTCSIILLLFHANYLNVSTKGSVHETIPIFLALSFLGILGLGRSAQ